MYEFDISIRHTIARLALWHYTALIFLLGYSGWYIWFLAH